MKKIKIITALLFTIFSLVGCNQQVPEVKNEILDIYGLNDFHGAFSEDTRNGYAGLSKIGAYLTSKVEDNPNTLLVSAGDMWQGSADSNLTRGKLLTESMNTIGFDATCVGNHEFDWDESAIEENVSLMDFPMLNCNIFYKGTKKRPSYFKPSTLVKKGNLNVGVIGAIMPGIGDDIIANISNKFDYSFSIDLIKQESDILYKNGADAVILLTHDGNYEYYEELCKESVISGKNYVNAVFLGHDHNVKQKFINGVPFVESGTKGKYISHIQLKIDKKDGSVSVESKINESINAKEQCVKTSIEVDKVYKKYESEISSIKNEEVGYASKYLSKSSIAKIATKGMFEFVNANVNEFGHISYASCINSGGVRATIPEGRVTYGQILEALPFDNQVSLLTIDKLAYNYLTGSNVSYIPDEVVFNEKGFTYLATIDYVALGITNYEKLHISNWILRDVIKELIKSDVFVEYGLKKI